MKNTFRLLLFLAGLPSVIYAQKGVTFYVDGPQLKEPCGNPVILKGVNKMNIWTDQTGASFPEIIKTGANAVRIVWAVRYDHDGNENTPPIPSSDAALDNLIRLCIVNKMIPIVEVHDATCYWPGMQMVLDYWKRPEILAIINKYKNYLLINIGNEIGDGNTTANEFESGYINAVSQLRNAGITVPLMIDGIDCGKNLEIIVQKAPSIIASDPLKNLLFSVHTYWPMNNGATKAFITGQFQSAKNAGIPFIIGELSKYGAWAGEGVSVCSAAGEVDYQWMAAECQRLGIGWLAWEWGPGNAGGGDPLCSVMDMTTNNLYSGLTGWGKDLVENPVYGIKATAKRADILLKDCFCENVMLTVTTTSIAAFEGRSVIYERLYEWRTNSRNIRDYILEIEQRGRARSERFIAGRLRAETSIPNRYKIRNGTVRLRVVRNDGSSCYVTPR